MRLFLYLFLSHIFTIKGFERKIKTSISFSDEEVVDERELVVPLGETVEFPCHAKEAGDFPNTGVVWRILYSDSVSKENKEEILHLQSQHGRFHVALSGIMYGFGLQSIHDGIIAECIQKIEMNHYFSVTSNYTRAVKYIASRLKVVINDCRNNKDPVLFGSCSSTITKNKYEVIEVDCHPLYTGQFCEVESKNGYLWEMLNYTPIVIMLLVIVIIAFFYSMIVKCTRRKHKMRMAKFLAEPPKRDRTKLFHASGLTAGELRALWNSLENCKADDDSGIGSGKTNQSILNMNNAKDGAKTRPTKKTCDDKIFQSQFDEFANGRQRVEGPKVVDRGIGENKELATVAKTRLSHIASPDETKEKGNSIKRKKEKSDNNESYPCEVNRPQKNNNNVTKRRSNVVKTNNNKNTAVQETP